MLRLTIKVAAKSNHQTYKMGAIVVKGNRILSTASNRVNRGSSLIKEKKWKNTLHAEQHAILKLLKGGHLSSLVNADLFVTRINKVGHAMNAKPCSFCYATALAVGIKRIFYTNNKGEVECLRVK